MNLSPFVMHAAWELGLVGREGTVAELAREIGADEGKLRVLVEVLVAMGVMVERDGRVVCGVVPERGEVVREGWGRIAEVVRSGRPVEVGAETVRAYHEVLLRDGAAAAAEVAAWMGDGPLVDMGGGAGAYARAYLEGDERREVTLVDREEVVAIAREVLAPYGARVRFVVGDARECAGEFGAAALINVLHLHPPAVCEELVAAAVRAVRPGGCVVVKEVRLDDGRKGPLEGLLFALNMVVYTDGGNVYEVGVLRRWMADAGLVAIEEKPVASEPEAVVLVGRKPRPIGDVFAEVCGVGGVAAVAAELDEKLDGRFPATLRRMLATAVALERQAGEDGRAAAIERHYTVLMPEQRRAQFAASTPFFHVPLDWERLPRLAGAIDRLVGVLRDSGVTADQIERAIGAGSGEELRARTPTIAALYRRSHYGGFMPLLYGGAADLAYFERRARERGWDAMQAIDRYLTAPLVHELCHFAPGRDALLPLHLDECVAGWLGVHVLPEFAYPAPGEDDAIFAAPLLSQIGGAMARAFGIAPLVRAHAGAEPWERALPAGFLAAAVRLGWDDWRARRTLHFLSDTEQPAPWVALALVAGAGRPLSGQTLASLATTPLVELAGELPADPAFDRAIVEDAVRAMCLWNEQVDGSFRTRTVLPAEIRVDAAAALVTAPRRGPVDRVAPRYWLPPAVAARLVAGGVPAQSVGLASLDAIPAAAAALCAGLPAGVH